MFVKKTNGYVIRNNRISTTNFLQALLVDWITDANVHFLNWVVVEDEKLCVQCKNMWGKVYERHNLVFPLPPLHPHCRCTIQPIQTAIVGTATNEKHNGADWWIKSQGKLPDYYITYQEAVKLGFKPKEGNLDKVAPGKMITRGQYFNRNEHLPEKPGRIWYEADINYSGGYRNSERILYSNDGLIFITLDHYRTFVEII